MASIRRGTSSPAAAAAAAATSDHHQSQSSCFLITSSSSTAPPPTASTITISSPSRKWASLHHHRHHHSFFFLFDEWLNNLRKKKKTRSFIFRVFLFFLLGCFLGFSPFPHLCLHDLKPHHFFFDSAPTINFHNNHNISQQHLPIPTSKLLIIVTPTYNRALQVYYLSRLAHTLRLVPPPLLWIVIEMDDSAASHETSHILRRAGVMYAHLVCDKKSSSDVKDRGVHQRNTALDHIERHRLDGIVYFADDDNVYSLHLFHHLRNIRKFGTWPVAMLVQNKNKATLEGPVCNVSQVIGWHTNEKSKLLRRFHVDMSGFAFNSTILWDTRRWRRPTSHPIRQLDTVKEGFQETTFMEQVVEDESQMESVPHGCSRIMNWHLHLEAKHLVYPKAWKVSRNLDVVVSSLGRINSFQQHHSR